MNGRGARTTGRVSWAAALLVGLQIVLDALMLLAIIALWNNDAPPFIYVAF